MNFKLRPIAALRDPRCYQIFALSSLVIYGSVILDFGVQWLQAIAIFAAAQLTQFVCSRAVGLSRYDPLSATITSLSLTMMLRTDLLVLAMLAAIIAIGSKFLIRARGKHIFNPANIALVSLMMISDRAWVSSGQWGSAAIGAFALACLGFLVLTRARRAETTVSFLISYAALIFGRAVWLGDPLSIPVHQLQNGALLIFAFFMISDPKTTPNSASARVVYGAFVAFVAYVIQFVFFEPNGPVLALVLSAPIVPLIDLVSNGERYQWNRKENYHAIPDHRHSVGSYTDYFRHGAGILRLLRRPRRHEPLQSGVTGRTRT